MDTDSVNGQSLTTTNDTQRGQVINNEELSLKNQFSVDVHNTKNNLVGDLQDNVEIIKSTGSSSLPAAIKERGEYLDAQNQKQQQLVDCQNNTNQSQKTVKEMQLIIQELMEKNEYQSKDIINLQQENHSQKSEIQSLRQENQSQQTEITGLKQENQRLKSEISQQKIEIPDLGQDNSSLPSEISQQKAEISELGQENSRLPSEISVFHHKLIMKRRMTLA